MTTDPADREAFISGLRGLADFLAANPEVAVPKHGDEILLFPCQDSDRENLQAVAAFAEAAGAAVVSQWNEHGECRATVKFGSLAYSALAHSKARIAAFDAEQSYTRNIQIDDAPAELGEVA